MKDNMKAQERVGEEGFYSYELLDAMRPNLGPLLPNLNSLPTTFL